MKYYVKGRFFDTAEKAMEYENELELKAKKEEEERKERDRREKEIEDSYEAYVKLNEEFRKDYGYDLDFYNDDEEGFDEEEFGSDEISLKELLDLFRK